GRQGGGIGQGVGGVDNVELFSRGDAAGELRIAENLGREIGAVVPDEGRVSALGDLPLLRVLELRRIGMQQGGDAAEPEEKPFAMRRVVAASHSVGIDDLQTAMRGGEGMPREDEQELGPGSKEPPNETFRRDAQTSADDGGELPAEHEDAHTALSCPLTVSSQPPRGGLTGKR